MKIHSISTDFSKRITLASWHTAYVVGPSSMRIAQVAPPEVTVPPSASAVADGGELLGQAAAEGRHECEEA